MTAPKLNDLLIITSRYTHRECENCGEPATKRHTYLLPNPRRNPLSKGFCRDDISWCSDADAFTCNTCKPQTPMGMTPDYGTFTKTEATTHMFLYWHEIGRVINSEES